MEKKDLERILSEILKPADFKKKGSYWTLNNNEITKIIDLQKSQYSNRFYINYGYIINAIPLGNLKRHIYNRLGASNKSTNEEIINMLDLEYQIIDSEREIRLKDLLYENLMLNIISINNESDILEELKRRPHLNDITLSVKKHFNLPID
ncbi:DUF4304 domain-containing protein [Flavobacterium lindanitolerans]|uniref:Uncharacterized protein DUF4304 n=1 Tax=Flavobacterium lindanitolerans TaxID=428988 RepID=A0A497V8Q2_9FLAO|nr:DUF4304 domain-containing protein [Flavobacterium lindanitolerans]MBC8643230.1 DUF4304 domain-containing protein [Flavobacterium lindanitolerans]PKW29235.1 uncharacterized protein DUF4304 [Flavobacterium lindanitolerans]RLJ35264.1 uncharacterized protein DUF4304 [Flavobacterium lindanitolerans]